MFERRGFLGQIPIAGTINLGQTANSVAQMRQLLREYSQQEQYYRNLAKDDPDYTDTANWYENLLNEAQASLTRTIQQGLQQQGVSPQGYVPPSMTTGQPYQSYPMVHMTPISPSPLMNELKMSTDLGPITLPPEGWTPLPPPSRPPVETPGTPPSLPPSSPTELPLKTSNPFEGGNPFGGETSRLPVPTGAPSGPVQQMNENPYSWNAVTGNRAADCAPPSIPDGKGGCMPGVQTGRGGGGYGGIINMGPSGAVPFGMGRAMLGRVQLVRRGF
jgi:hypothetical protein